MGKPGILGLALAALGIILLLFTFYMSYEAYLTIGWPAMGMEGAIALLLSAAVKALFLGIMAWVGAIFLLRGAEYFKVDKGVGMVTFKVEKGVGVASISEEALKKEA